MASSKKSSKGDDDVKREKPLQAVLLADSFSETFRPVSFEQPKALFPLGNAPMISYSLELLVSNDVKEVFVFCVSDAEKIQEYLSVSGWDRRLSIECVTSSVCSSAGDAMRELDQMGVIESDPFILISGDVVSNVDLKPYIEAHKQRREKRAENIMTMLFRPVGRTARTRALEDDLVIGINDSTQQIMYYSDDSQNAAISIPKLILEGNDSSFSLRTDLLDCHVDICSPEVLWRFSENFDYQHLRKGFVASEVANLDLGQYIFAEVVGSSASQEYSARVHDPRTYRGVVNDFVHRWIFPIVPDLNVERNTRYKRTMVNSGGKRALLYKEQNVTIPRSAVLSRGVMLGASTQLGNNSVVEDSTIGKNGQVGDNVQIIRSILWDDVIVEKGAVVEDAILCHGVVVKEGAVVPRGCILSFGVVIGKGMKIPEYTRITTGQVKEDTGFDDEDVEEEDGWDEVIVGSDGKGRCWINESDEEEEEEEDDFSEPEDPYESISILRSRSMHCTEEEEVARQRHVMWTVRMEDDEADEEEEISNDGGSPLDDIDGMGIDMGEIGDSLPPMDDGTAFEKAVADILVSGWKNSVTFENLRLEVFSLKLSQNKSFEDCIRGAIAGVVSLAIEAADKEAGNISVQLLKQFKSLVTHWAQLFADLSSETSDEEAIVEAIEQQALNQPLFENVFPHVLKLIYDEDIVSEEAILQWASNRKQDIETSGTPENRLFESKLVQNFLVFLEEAEEESDDDDEEDDDE